MQVLSQFSAQTRAPIDRLEVLEYEPDTKSVHLSWDRVNIPPYNMDEEPLMYMLEYQEPPLPEWKTLITGEFCYSWVNSSDLL